MFGSGEVAGGYLRLVEGFRDFSVQSCCLAFAGYVFACLFCRYYEVIVWDVCGGDGESCPFAEDIEFGIG